MHNKKALVRAMQAGGIMAMLLLAMGGGHGIVVGGAVYRYLQEVWKWVTGRQG